MLGREILIALHLDCNILSGSADFGKSEYEVYCCGQGLSGKAHGRLRTGCTAQTGAACPIRPPPAAAPGDSWTLCAGADGFAGAAGQVRFPPF